MYSELKNKHIAFNVRNVFSNFVKTKQLHVGISTFLRELNKGSNFCNFEERGKDDAFFYVKTVLNVYDEYFDSPLTIDKNKQEFVVNQDNNAIRIAYSNEII